MNQLYTTLATELYKTISNSDRGRRLTYPVSHYFEKIWYVLRTGIAWRDLQGPLNWNSYFKFFYKCVNNNFSELLHHIIIKIAKKSKQLHLENLYIDSTMIKNIGGVDFLGKNHRNRKGNKVTVIISDNGVPLGISLTTANNHDVKEVIPTINSIKIKIAGSRLIGDKGYMSKKLWTNLRKDRIQYLYPTKKNTRPHYRLSIAQKEAMKVRWKVENTFAHFRQFRKVDKRWDKCSKTYLFWSWMAMSLISIKKLGL